MAMGNNPMMYIDADGKMWNPFKAIGQALDYAWGKANQFAQWADQVGIPSVNIGYGMSSSGQIQPVGDINGHPLFSNESQYEVASQNAVNAINDSRGDYFSQQQMNANYSQLLNKQIMNVTHNIIQNVPTNYKNAKHWVNEHLFLDVEFRVDRGAQAGVDVEVFGFKAGLNGEKGTRPIAQLNFGFNGGFYGDGTSPPNPYGYGNVKDSIRTSWNAGIGLFGGSQTYDPHRKLFKVGPLRSESMNVDLFEITNNFRPDGSQYHRDYSAAFGIDISAWLGISLNIKLGYHHNLK